MPESAQPVYISVDVETAGPNPSQYSLLAIGACTLYEPQETFYIELQPVNEDCVPEAMRVSGLNWDHLKENGVAPQTAMQRFAQWVEAVSQGAEPVFVAFNAPYDWMFVNDYFHRYVGRNPFGHKALDIKAFFMGLAGVSWVEASMKHISPRYLGNQLLSHHALRDALDQARIFRQMIAEAQQKA